MWRREKPPVPSSWTLGHHRPPPRGPCERVLSGRGLCWVRRGPAPGGLAHGRSKWGAEGPGGWAPGGSDLSPLPSRRPTASKLHSFPRAVLGWTLAARPPPPDTGRAWEPSASRGSGGQGRRGGRVGHKWRAPVPTGPEGEGLRAPSPPPEPSQHPTQLGSLEKAILGSTQQLLRAGLCADVNLPKRPGLVLRPPPALAGQVPPGS